MEFNLRQLEAAIPELPKRIAKRAKIERTWQNVQKAAAKLENGTEWEERLKAKWAPELAEMENIIATFDAVRAKANKDHSIERMRNWARTLRDGRDYKRAQYKHIKGKAAKPTRAMMDQGVWTTEESKLHELMLRFWKHLYNWYGINKPPYAKFKMEYGDYIQKMEFPTTKITGDGIQKNASKMKKWAGKGPEGINQELTSEGPIDVWNEIG